MAISSDRQLRVVLATDDSGPAKIAEDWVRRLRFGAEPILDIVCIAGAGMTRLGWGLQSYRAPVKAAIEGIRQRELYAAERISNEVGERLQRAGRTVHTLARQGDCATELLALSEVERPDLIVLGSRGRSALAAAILGSVTQALIARASTALLVARPPLTEDGPLPRHIMLAVDGKTTAGDVGSWLNRAGWLRATRLTVLGLLGEKAGLEDENPVVIEDVGRLIRADAIGLLQNVIAPLVDDTTELTFEPRSGHPLQAILDVIAELRDVDLVAVPRPRSRGGSEFAAKIARHAPTSVLLVPSN